MALKITEEQLHRTLTIREIRCILNRYGVPYNEFAFKVMIVQAKPHRFKLFMRKCGVYAITFFKAVWHSIKTSGHRGKYAKGGVKRGRKDM